ncbi:unnamed protein product [Brassica oleracea]
MRWCMQNPLINALKVKTFGLTPLFSISLNRSSALSIFSPKEMTISYSCSQQFTELVHPNANANANLIVSDLASADWVSSQSLCKIQASPKKTHKNYIISSSPSHTLFSTSTPPLPLSSSPPFMTKKYDMVEDPTTDTVVCWRNGRNSFMSWYSHTTLLPRYFRNIIFPRFIRQFITYVSAFFTKDKPLLKRIKRRRNMGLQTMNQQGSESGCRNGAASARYGEALAKALNNPNFVQQFALMSKEKKGLFRSDVGRKRGLLQVQAWGLLRKECHMISSFTGRKMIWKHCWLQLQIMSE